MKQKKMLVYPPDTKPSWNVYDYGATMGSNSTCNCARAKNSPAVDGSPAEQP